MPPIVYVVGHFYAKTDAGTFWDLRGVFTLRDAAIAACVEPTDFVMEVGLNVAYPPELVEKDVFYPLAEK